MIELLAFAGVMALGQFSPGPDMVLLTRSALAEGAGYGVRMACGIATGLALHAAVAVGGVAIVFERSPAIHLAMAMIAAVYLVWLAIQLFQAGLAALKTHGGGVATVEAKASSAYRRGLLCNLLNPKVALFLAAVSAPFLQGDRPVWWAAALWGIIVVEGLVLWSVWACVLQWKPVKSGYQRASPWLDLGFGLALAVLAALLLASQWA